MVGKNSSSFILRANCEDDVVTSMKKTINAVSAEKATTASEQNFHSRRFNGGGNSRTESPRSQTVEQLNLSTLL